MGRERRAVERECTGVAFVFMLCTCGKFATAIANLHFSQSHLH